MTKHNGRYYLQYAAPGTEFNTYADGLMYCDQRYTDWPMALEDAPFSLPRWMLLSHGKPVRASSGENAACAVDESIRTWRSASGNQPGECLEVDLQAACQVNAVQINFAERLKPEICFMPTAVPLAARRICTAVSSLPERRPITGCRWKPSMPICRRISF